MEVGHRFRPRIGPASLQADKDPLPSFTLWISAAVHVSSTLASLDDRRASRYSATRALERSRVPAGFGIIERLADSSALIALFSAVYLLLRHRGPWRNLPIYGFLLWFLLSLGLSGSKGALLSFGQYVLSILFVYGSLRAAKRPVSGADAWARFWSSPPLCSQSLCWQCSRRADLVTAALALRLPHRQLWGRLHLRLSRCDHRGPDRQQFFHRHVRRVSQHLPPVSAGARTDATSATSWLASSFRSWT